VLLRVVQARERATVSEREALNVEEDGGGDQRACEGAAARFVGAGDEATLE
jgi:hypothetical protein